jgi:hypothetical protein
LVPAVARCQNITRAEAFPTNTTKPTTKTPTLKAFQTARLIFIPFAMDDITNQRMNAMALLGNANVNNFNAGLFTYLSYVATNTDAGTEIKWSKAPKDLQDLIMTHKGGNLGLTSTQIKVLNFVSFNWLVRHEVRWNKTYEELVKFHAANGHCNVPCDISSLGNWVNQQR